MNNDIDFYYYSFLKALMESPIEVAGTKEINNAYMLLKDINNNIVSIRNISPSYLFGEWLWYFTGRRDVKFIGAFGSMWKRLSDDDLYCNSAYGYLMKHQFGFDQVEKVIELLRFDPDSRRAVINLNTPNYKVIETKDEPCTIALQYLIRGDKLHCTCMMRSNDIWFGFPYDVAFFTELQKYIADKLKVDYGSYAHFVTSLHLYERNYKDVERILERPVSKKIKFNRTKFHINKDYAAGLIDVALKHCDEKYVKDKLIIKIAENLFDFKYEEKEVKK